MFKNRMNIDVYKKLINKIIINDRVKEEILNQIDYFGENGKIICDGYNLYAKSKKGKDFLEIKYVNKTFLCNYSEWDFHKHVTISEIDLKNNNTKVERKEKVDYVSDDNVNNSTSVEELEQIYNSDNNLIYESKLKGDYKYKTFGTAMKYTDEHYFTNYFELNKKWYISNGSIINYNVTKSFMNENSELKEYYSICPNSYNDGFMTYLNFVELDEEIFKLFMSGQISIDKVLNSINKDEYKKLLKNIPRTEII